MNGLKRHAGPLEAIATLFAHEGRLAYGEDVTQLEHALQTAALAEAERCDDSLVVAALLHDIGHLLGRNEHELAADGRDDRHERIGAAWIARHFQPSVSEPVRLHVAAKQYLVATDPDYRTILSAASRRSLAVQGGALDAEARARFEREPFAEAATRLRRWDDRAKVPGAAVAPIEHHLDRCRALLAAARASRDATGG